YIFCTKIAINIYCDGQDIVDVKLVLTRERSIREEGKKVSNFESGRQENNNNKIFYSSS
ncbi:Hypothetical protein FKW44_005288, partial [Caligus rogercresseyi]